MDKLIKIQSQFNRVIPKEDERYLNTLKNYIDDKTFNEKLNVLPKLTSAVVKRLEKTVNNDEQRAKLYNNLPNTAEKVNKSKEKYKSHDIQIKINRDFSKVIYLVFDNDNNHSDFSKVEEALENKTKVVTNPIKVFLHESNDKIVQQALGMIVDNVFRDRAKRIYAKNISTTANENNTNVSTVNETNLNTSHLKTDVKQDDMVWFKKKCENIGIVTLEQKLDLYQIYHENNMIPKTEVISLQSGKFNKINAKQNKKHRIDVNSNTNIPTVESRQLQTPTQKGIYDSFPEKTPIRSKTLTDLSQKYLADLKIKFKIVDDSFLQNKLLEQFYNEIVYKAKNSKENMKSFDTMSNLEKIRCIKNHKELSPMKSVIKEIDLTPEKFIYLIFKRSIDIRILNHLNLNKTYIGDIGCSYVLFLIDQHSKYLTYLNLSYTKFGKSASEFLTAMLSKNTLRISSLNISGNQLGDKIFCEICLGISKNETLNRLFTFDNNLGKTSAMIIGTLLKYDKKLKLLDLSKNYFNQYIYNIFKGLIMNSTLEILTLRECEIENSELKSLSATLNLNHTLKELYLDSNKLTNLGSVMISNILNSNHSIEILSILGNRIDIEGVEDIIARQKLTPIKIWNKTDYLKQKMDNNIESIIYEYF